MDALKSLMQPLVGGSSVVDGMKLVVLGGTVETARRISSTAWSHFVNSFFLTAHFCEEEHPYDWLVLWLSRRPEWQRSREFEATLRAFTNTNTASSSTIKSPADLEWEEAEHEWEAYNASLGAGGPSSSAQQQKPYSSADTYTPTGTEDDPDPPLIEKPKSRIIFQPTYDTTHTIFFRGHWLRVKRNRKMDTGSEMLSISVIARSNNILKQLVLQAKKEYEAECVHRIQIYFADSHGSWRWTDSRAKRPLGSIVLNPGVKEMLVDDAKDFLRSEKWYMDRGIPFRRGYLLYGVPGSGKSSLIHALAGYLQLDIYVVSLSASWISDSMLTSLMGRVPARCVVLLEDLDAAFTRSTSREDDEDEELLNSNSNNSGKNKNNSSNNRDNHNNNDESSGGFGSAFGYSSRRRGGGGSRSARSGEHLSDVNTLSLSGLLNALDGVAAAEGRLLFATTNHLEKLDPALSRPGRMDVWIEFKNASRWQAEALFRNFFPCEEEEDDANDADDVAQEGLSARETREARERREREVDEAMKRIKVEVSERPPSAAGTSRIFAPSTPTETSSTSLWSLASSATSLLSGTPASLSALSSSTSSVASSPVVLSSPLPSFAMPLSSMSPSMSSTPLSSLSSSSPGTPSSSSGAAAASNPDPKSFGGTNTAYLPPPVELDVKSRKHSAAPLDKKTLGVLAKQFADGVPEEEFSVASLQGYLLKHKSNPHAAASTILDWVTSERTLRTTRAAEKASRDEHAKVAREKRLKELKEKKREKEEKEEKEREMEAIKAKLAEREKEEELVKMREKLREKEEGVVKKDEGEGEKKKDDDDEEKKDDDDDDDEKKADEGTTKNEKKKDEEKKKVEEEEDEDKENWCDALS